MFRPVWLTLFDTPDMTEGGCRVGGRSCHAIPGGSRPALVDVTVLVFLFVETRATVAWWWSRVLGVGNERCCSGRLNALIWMLWTTQSGRAHSARRQQLAPSSRRTTRHDYGQQPSRAHERNNTYLIGTPLPIHKNNNHRNRQEAVGETSQERRLASRAPPPEPRRFGYARHQ